MLFIQTADKKNMFQTIFKLKPEHFIKVGLLVLFFVLTCYLHYLFLFDTNFKYKIQKFQNLKPRSLQQVTGSILGDRLDIRIVKIQYKNKIYLDFFSKESNSRFRFMDSLVLKGKHNGFFEYWGESISLGLLDENGDGYLEVVAPTFDAFLKPQLNVIFYDKETNKFQLKPSLSSNPSIK